MDASKNVFLSQYEASLQDLLGDHIEIELDQNLQPTAEYVDEELQNLLREWNVEHLYSACTQNRINLTALKYMTPTYKDKFFSLCNIDLGTQIIFSHHLHSWQIATNTTVTTDLSSFSAANSSASSSNDNNVGQNNTADIFELNDFLNSSSQGRSICDYYSAHSELNDGCRKIILDLIVNHVIKYDLKWSVKVASKIANKIKNMFPSEEESYYYMKEPGKSPSGALYMKYYNMFRKLKSCGLREKRPYNKKENVFGNAPSPPVPDDNLEEILKKIEQDNCTWAELEAHWNASSEYRISLIKNINSTAEILEKWEHYKRILGFKLIDIDFKTMYPNVGSLINRFHDVIPSMLKIIKERVKDPECLCVLKQYLQQEHPTENTSSSCIFYLLHAVLVPTSRETIVKDNKKRIIKYSIKDSQNSFFLFANTPCELEENLSSILSKKEAIQPFIMFTGTIIDPKDIMVYFDGIRYKFPSLIQGIDICFKIFMLFNLKYPLASVLVWTFLQKYFYKITTNKDKNHASINQLISQIK